MPQQRPTSVLVIAIFHFILGGLGLMCNLLATAELALGGDVAFRWLEQVAPKPVQIIDTAVSLCFACVLLAAGYGLVHMASWGRSLSLVYAYATLIEKIALGCIQPVPLVSLGLLIPLIYPFVVLVVLNTATVKTAFNLGEFWVGESWWQWKRKRNRIDKDADEWQRHPIDWIILAFVLVMIVFGVILVGLLISLSFMSEG